MRSVISNLAPPFTANAKVRGGYQVHKELEKYGNKAGDLEHYPPWGKVTIRSTIIRGGGRVPASSFPKPPLRGGCSAIRPLCRASYPPINTYSACNFEAMDLGNMAKLVFTAKKGGFP